MRIFIKIWVIQPQKLKLSSIEIIQAPHLSSCDEMWRQRCCWNSWTANNTRALCPMEMFSPSLPRFILAIKISLETKTWSIFDIQWFSWGPWDTSVLSSQLTMLKRGRLPSSCWAAPVSPPFSDQIKMKTSPGLQMKTKRASGLKSLQEWKGPDQWKVSKEEWKGQSQRKKSLRSEGHLQRYWEGFGWGCCFCL